MRKKNLILIVILLLGLVLRLVNLGQSFWLDEAAQVIESSRPFAEQLKIGSDFHPPLYHLFLHFWLYFGSSEIWVRLPSVLMGVGSIYLLYKIAYNFFNRNVALIPSFFLATSAYHIWYSQEARPYMLFVFLSLLSTYLLLKNKWKTYFFITLLSMYSLYYAPFLILAHLVYVYLFSEKAIGKLVFYLSLDSILFLPWTPYLLDQLQHGLRGAFKGWTNVVSVSTYKILPLTFAKFILGKSAPENILLHLLLIAPVFIIFILSLWLIRKTKTGRIIAILFFVPVVTAFVMSFFIPVVAPQRLIFLLPLFYLLIAAGVSKLSKKLMTAAIILVVSTNLIGTIDYYFNPYTQREQWRQAVAFVDRMENKNNLALFVFPEPFAPYLWYKKGYIESYGIAPEFIITHDDFANLSLLTRGKKRIFLFQYLTGLTDPNNETKAYLINTGYSLTNTRDFPGVGFIYVFEKNNE